MHGLAMPTTNPFNLPVRPNSQHWYQNTPQQPLSRPNEQHGDRGRVRSDRTDQQRPKPTKIFNNTGNMMVRIDNGAQPEFWINGERARIEPSGDITTFSRNGRHTFKPDGTSSKWSKNGDRVDYKPDRSVANVNATESGETVVSLRQKWEGRGALIQKHERRLSDSNKLLAHMWNRLDPKDRVLGAMQADPAVQDYVEKRAESAYSEHPHMQNYFDRLAAFDYLNRDSRGRSSSMAESRDEKRVNSLEATIKIQAALVQEKNEVLAGLQKQLTKYRTRDGTIARLEGHLRQANEKIRQLNVASQNKSPAFSRPSRASRARTTRAPSTAKVCLA